MRLSTVLLASVCLAACAPSARLPFASGVGPDPALPPPAVETIPAVDVGAAVGWAPGQAPQAAEGLTVAAFARDLDHPRWLLALGVAGWLLTIYLGWRSLGSLAKVFAS